MIVIEIYTTEPAIQFYSENYLSKEKRMEDLEDELECVLKLDTILIKPV